MTLRIGGGYHTFEEYVPINQRDWQMSILQNMMKSKESLEWCCEAIMNNEKIPTVVTNYNANSYQQEAVINHRAAQEDSEARRGGGRLSLTGRNSIGGAAGRRNTIASPSKSPARR